jgi:hypothetical protein
VLQSSYVTTMPPAINIERFHPEIARCALQLRETIPRKKHYLTGEGIQISKRGFEAPAKEIGDS